MAKKGTGAYAGKHWMQLPENRNKMLRQLKKMQRGRKNRSIAKSIIRAAKKTAPIKRQGKKATSLVINGWRITLGKDEVRIENE